MVNQKTISTMGLIVMVIIGWEKIISFLNSFLEGVDAVLSATPPIILLGLLGWMIWWLGKN